MNNTQQIITAESPLNLFIKEILVFEDQSNTEEVQLPFFADGFPGLLFHKSKDGMMVLPHEKMMPVIFLYGQTIHPIKLKLNGAYQVIIFQLYPFVVNSFFNIDLNQITDNCFDLKSYDHNTISKLENRLLQSVSLQSRISFINNFLFNIFENKKKFINRAIEDAVKLILEHKGLISIYDLAEKTNSTLRTLQRNFLKETGLTPKNFSKIVQFQTSLKQISGKDFRKLTDIVYENGFADQSHFIRVFKYYTGATPGTFLQQSN
ncbi:MAG: AraC family transcriptional regulator [Agriterribacter sp.]